MKFIEMCPAGRLLLVLINTSQHNANWVRYVVERSSEVQAWIDSLRRYAALKPGKVQDEIDFRCDVLQSILDEVGHRKGIKL